MQTLLKSLSTYPANDVYLETLFNNAPRGYQHQPYVNPLEGVPEAFAKGVYEAPGELVRLLEAFGEYQGGRKSTKPYSRAVDDFTQVNEMGYNPDDYGASPLLQSLARFSGNVVGDPLNAIPGAYVGKQAAVKTGQVADDLARLLGKESLRHPMRNQAGALGEKLQQSLPMDDDWMEPFKDYPEFLKPKTKKEADGLLAAKNRLAAQDYQREMQKEAGRLTAAVRDSKTGKIYTGNIHAQAIDKAPKHGSKEYEQDPDVWNRLSRAWQDDTADVGFINSKGEFINRDEANELMGVLTVEDARDLAQGKMTAPPKPLPMDEASRMARAREMGFDTDTVWHHGTDEQFESFDRGKIGSNFGFDKKGFFFTTDKNTANISRKSHPYNTGGGARYKWDDKQKTAAEGGKIMDVNLSIKNPLKISDIKGFEYDSSLTPEGMYDLNRDVIEKALEGSNYDGIIISSQGRKLAMVRNPNQIRDIKAKFDPNKKDSANILAGGAAVGINEEDRNRLINAMGK